MKLFKANQSNPSEEDRAASLRLENIASRYRGEPTEAEQGSSDAEEAPNPLDPSE
jgi:hypothetical protein